jgi:D-tyrosyl-tRNA(Tyr) deacylase
VSSARVRVAEEEIGRIDHGLVALVGVEAGDSPADLEYVASKIRDVRIFADDQGRMNRSVVDAGGAVLVVSQFTLLGDARKGRRPAFDRAAPPDTARDSLRAADPPVETGRSACGSRPVSIPHARRTRQRRPVTILLDSRRTF